jgi:hypothetical protein
VAETCKGAKTELHAVVGYKAGVYGSSVIRNQDYALRKAITTEF